MERELRGKELDAWLRDRRNQALESRRTEGEARASAYENWLNDDATDARRICAELASQMARQNREIRRLWSVVGVIGGFVLVMLIDQIQWAKLWDAMWDLVVDIAGIVVGLVAYVVKYFLLQPQS